MGKVNRIVNRQNQKSKLKYLEARERFFKPLMDAQAMLQNYYNQGAQAAINRVVTSAFGLKYEDPEITYATLTGVTEQPLPEGWVEGEVAITDEIKGV